MRKKFLIIINFIMAFFYCNYLFAENVNHIVIYDMPQDLRDFDVRQEKLTYQFVEDSIKRDCSNIENKLLSMKNKYKNNKDYSARLTVYDDTIIIYDEYKKTQIKNESNE
ncbi:hypothetical protein ABNR48_000292 [Salmonella enterica]|nr:hypothetical protein [Salmonella enterica subsp. enterica serovar Enteritidis]EEM5218218.1 hypothetical protein [Salmonella enterica subsp. enterica serovar Enteritidis]